MRKPFLTLKASPASFWQCTKNSRNKKLWNFPTLLFPLKLKKELSRKKKKNHQIQSPVMENAAEGKKFLQLSPPMSNWCQWHFQSSPEDQRDINWEEINMGHWNTGSPALCCCCLSHLFRSQKRTPPTASDTSAICQPNLPMNLKAQ